MEIQKCLVRILTGLTLAAAGVVAFAMGTATAAGAQGIDTTRTAKGGDSTHSDPAWCYQIGSKILCLGMRGPAGPKGPPGSAGSTGEQQQQQQQQETPGTSGSPGAVLRVGRD
jgi:hypothetical protein